MAAALFKIRLMAEETEWQKWRVDSAGTWAEPGMPAVSQAQQIMLRRGQDISHHRSRLVSYELLKRFLLILTMEAGQAEALRFEFQDLAGRIFMLSEMSGDQVDVRDPMGSNLAEFERTAERIDTLIKDGLPRILELVRDNQLNVT